MTSKDTLQPADSAEIGTSQVAARGLTRLINLPLKLSPINRIWLLVTQMSAAFLSLQAHLDFTGHEGTDMRLDRASHVRDHQILAKRRKRHFGPLHGRRTRFWFTHCACYRSGWDLCSRFP